MATVVKEREEIKVENTKRQTAKDFPGEFPRFWTEKDDLAGFFRNYTDYCDFWKNCHTTSYRVMSMWGEYTMKMWDTFIDQTMYFQKEGRTLFQEWMETYQDICKDYQKMGEKNFDSLTSAFKQ